jgi:hypothetical protein
MKKPITRFVLPLSALVLSLTSNLAFAQVVQFAPVQINEWTWHQGNLAWEQDNLSRLGRSVWVLDTDTGEAAMIQPDGYPTLVGTFTSQGQQLTMQGNFFSSAGATGSITAEFYAEVDFSSGVLLMRIWYVSGSTLAAVINGTDFGSTNERFYEAALQLTQLNP